MTSVHILQTRTCKNLSGHSKLTFHIGSKNNEFYFSISKNTGGGFFSTEWIALKDIQSALKKRPKDTPITSLYLYPLFKGKSVNTPSFLLAALKSCDLVIPVKGKRRHFELTNEKEFLEEMKSLASPRVSAAVQRKRSANRSKSTKTTSRKVPARAKKKTVRK